MDGQIELVQKRNNAILIRQDLEGGRVKLIYADPYSSTSKDFSPDGAAALLSGGDPLGLLELAAGSEAVELAKIEDGLVELAADSAAPEGYLDEERVAAYGRRRGLGYTEARRQLMDHDTGNARAKEAEMVGRVAAELSVPYADAAGELVRVGAIEA